jgi:hypothetical protein
VRLAGFATSSRLSATTVSTETQRGSLGKAGG